MYKKYTYEVLSYLRSKDEGGIITKIVISIPEDAYKEILQGDYISDGNFRRNMIEAVRNGTPLPKGHGRLIDADEVLKSMDTWDKFGYTETGCFVREPYNTYVPYVHYEDMVKAVSNTQTIIEADGGDAE